MKREYWNRMAENYEEEIFEVSREDKKGLVSGKIREMGGTGSGATDVGCGIGHFLPVLSESFKDVLAVDISKKCIDRARAVHSGLGNVTYRVADLSRPGLRLAKADFALAVNSVITASLAARNRMLDVVCRCLRPGGHLVMVVPSLESALLTDARRIDWNIRDGLSAAGAVRAGFPGKDARARLHEGVVFIDGVKTKHYLEEELMVLLQSRGMDVVSVEKIEYGWNTEFEEPPRWMKAPFPWDWLVVGKLSG